MLDKKHWRKIKNAKTGQTSLCLGFTKKLSTLPCVVWAEESKTGLGFEIVPSYDAVPTRSQLVTDRQSSCICVCRVLCFMGTHDVHHKTCQDFKYPVNPKLVYSSAQLTHLIVSQKSSKNIDYLEPCLPAVQSWMCFVPEGPFLVIKLVLCISYFWRSVP